MRHRASRCGPAVGAVAFLALLVLSAPLAAATNSADRVRIQEHLSQDAVRPGAQIRAALELKIAPTWHINSGDPGVEGLIATRVEMGELPEGLEVSDWELPEGEARSFAFSPKPLSVYEGKVVLRATVSAAAGLVPSTYTLEGKVRVQACNDRMCLRPGRKAFKLQVRVVPEGTAVAALSPELFPSLGPAAPSGEAGPGTGAPEGKVANLLRERGTALTLVVIFFWGLLLCLTPCVFPMIPITVGYFSNQAAGSRFKALVLAFLYAQGLALVYAILGTVAGVTGAMMGSLLQNPWILLGVAVVLVTLSLSMFGLYEFRIPGLESSARGRTGYLGAFIMGAILAVVAAPCIGPFSVSLLAYVGQRGDPWFGFWAFLILAQGLGLPFMVLAFFSGASLFRSGEWMVWVKKVLGVLIIAMALWFIGLTGWVPDGVMPWAILALAAIGALYLGFFEGSGKGSVRFRIVKIATAVVILAAAAFLVWITRPKADALQWQPFSVAALEADQAAGRPAVVDFYADWCIPCFELEHRTFNNPEVAPVLQKFSRYKADMTHGTDETRDWEDRYNVAGVPTILFFGVAGEECIRLQEFVDAEELLRLLDEKDLMDITCPDPLLNPAQGISGF